MDYSLPALKLLCFQLRHAVSSSPSSDIIKVSTIYGRRFQRVWIQGVLVSVSPPDENSQRRAVIDDGTGVAELIVQLDHACKVGMYVMAVGVFTPCAADHAISLVEVHKIVDLSSYPDREAIWNLEVIEANNLFYNQKTAKSVSRLL
ncbi:hypothetical protein ZOSMA_166G00560 [Zostera marina]|uniref:Uncharacterized protein n=1 Tax=Zostera marina TaxID=29655 RepID=A0A0K9PTP9_ZOSMR|nr:hypothetical protein ZOSMA_166G00560 [Zostera marina]